MSPKTKSTSAVEDKPENTHLSENDENRPDVISSNLPKDQLSVQITQPVEEEERPCICCEFFFSNFSITEGGSR